MRKILNTNWQFICIAFFRHVDDFDSLFWESADGILQRAFLLPRNEGELYISRVILMSSDKHTTFAEFVANKNVIKRSTPFFCFLPYLNHSTPFPSTASRRFTGPAVGRKLDGEKPEQNVLILLCLRLFEPYAGLRVCVAVEWAAILLLFSRSQFVSWQHSLRFSSSLISCKSRDSNSNHVTNDSFYINFNLLYFLPMLYNLSYKQRFWNTVISMGHFKSRKLDYASVFGSLQ